MELSQRREGHEEWRGGGGVEYYLSMQLHTCCRGRKAQKCGRIITLSPLLAAVQPEHQGLSN